MKTLKLLNYITASENKSCENSAKCKHISFTGLRSVYFDTTVTHLHTTASTLKHIFFAANDKMSRTLNTLRVQHK